MVSAAYTQIPAAQFATLSRVRRQMDRAFNDSVAMQAGICALPADIVETADELRFVLEVPGMGTQDIEVTVEDGVLTVAGEKSPMLSDASSAASFRLAERRYGRFTRQFRLPRTADASGIEASCDHGLLTIRVPRTEAAKARRIEVQGDARAEQASAQVAKA